MKNDEDVQAAFQKLEAWKGKIPKGRYRHVTAPGTYLVHDYSVDESSLEPLVHFVNEQKGFRWTRSCFAFSKRFTLQSVIEHRRPITAEELAKKVFSKTHVGASWDDYEQWFQMRFIVKAEMHLEALKRIEEGA